MQGPVNLEIVVANLVVHMYINFQLMMDAQLCTFDEKKVDTHSHKQTNKKNADFARVYWKSQQALDILFSYFCIILHTLCK